MNAKGLELAISTLVILFLGILVMIGIAYALTGGFKSLNSSSKPFLDMTKSSAVKQACLLACQNEDKLAFCENDYQIDGDRIKCTDNRLEIACETITCGGNS